MNRLLLATAAALVVACPAMAQFTIGFTIGCPHGVAAPYAPYAPYMPYAPYAAPVAPYVPYYAGPVAPGPMVPAPTNPSTTGTPPGVGGPPGPGGMPPGTNSCDLINAIRDLTKEVREFKEAYKQVNKDKLQKVGLDPSPAEAGLARLKAAQSGGPAGADHRSPVDRQLAELRRAQAGMPPATVVVAR